MGDELDILLRDFYAKYANQDISDDKIQTIKDTYGDDYDTLLRDLYAKYAQSDLEDSKLETIITTYGLKKKVDSDDSLDGDDGTSDLDPGDGESQGGDEDSNIILQDEEEKEPEETDDEVSIFETPEYTGDHEINGQPYPIDYIENMLELPGVKEQIKNGEMVITTTDEDLQKIINDILSESEEETPDDNEYIPQTEEEEIIEEGEEGEGEEGEIEEEEIEEEEVLPQAEIDRREERKELIEIINSENLNIEVNNLTNREIRKKIKEQREKKQKEEERAKKMINLEERLEKISENQSVYDSCGAGNVFDGMDIEEILKIVIECETAIKNQKISEERNQQNEEIAKKEIEIIAPMPHTLYGELDVITYINQNGEEVEYGFNRRQSEENKKIQEKYKKTDLDFRFATVDPEEVYKYLLEKNFTEIQAQAMIANIMQESRFEVGAKQRVTLTDESGNKYTKEQNPKETYTYEVKDENGEGTGEYKTAYYNPGFGLFQHTYDTRKNGFIEYFKERDLDWRDSNNWKHQIDYILTEKETETFIEKSKGLSLEETTILFMLEWERPADQSDDAQQERIDNLKIIKYFDSRPKSSNMFKKGGIVRKYQEGGYTPQTQEIPQDTIPQTTQDNVPIPGSGQQTEEEYKPQAVAMQPWDYMNDIDATNYRRLLAEGKTQEAQVILDKYPEAKKSKIIESVGEPNDSSPDNLQNKILNYDLIKNEILYNNPLNQEAAPEDLREHAIKMLENIPWQYYRGGGLGYNPVKVYGEDYQNNPNYIELVKRDKLAQAKNLQAGDEFITISDDEIITKKELIQMIEEDPDIMDNIDYLNISGEEELPDYIINNPEFAKIYSRRYDFPYLGDEINNKITGSSGVNGEFTGGVRIETEEDRRRYIDALNRGWVYIGKNDKGKDEYLFTPSGAVIAQGDDGENPLIRNNGLDIELIEIYSDDAESITKDFLSDNVNYRLETKEEIERKESVQQEESDVLGNKIMVSWNENNNENEIDALFKLNKLRQSKGLPPIITENLSKILDYERDGFNVVLNEYGELTDLDTGLFDESKTFTKGDVEFEKYLSQNGYEYPVNYIKSPGEPGLYQDGIATDFYINKQDYENIESGAVGSLDAGIGPKVISKEEAGKLAMGDYMVEKYIRENPDDPDVRKWVDYYSKDPTIFATESGFGPGGLSREMVYTIRDQVRATIEAKAYEKFAESMNNALGSMDKVIEKTGIAQEAEEIGEQLLVAEDWIEKQINLLSKFPTKIDENGMMVPDAENMTDLQIEDYNKLVQQIQSFNEDIYMPIMDRQKDFNNMEIIKQYSGMMDSYNLASKWRYELMDRNTYWGEFSKDLAERQMATDKAYSEGQLWGLPRWTEQSLKGSFGNLLAGAPRWFKGLATDDDIYDWTDALADGWEFQKDYNAMLLTPTLLGLGSEFNFTTVRSSESGRTTDGINENDLGKDFKLVLSEDGITPITVMTMDDIAIPMDTPLAQHIIQKYQDNPTAYNLELDENNGAWWNSLGQSGIDLFVDIMASKRISVLGKTEKAKRYIHGASMMGIFNVRTYNDYRQAYIDEIGGSLSDADDYARYQTMIISLTQLINPNFNTGKGFSAWLNPKNYTKAWKNLSLATGRRALWSGIKYNTKVIGKNATTEGVQELSELEVEHWMNKGYNYFTDGRDFDLTRNMTEYKDAFTIGATLGGVVGGGSQVRVRGFKSRLQQEALFYGYQNQDVFFKSLDNLVGTKNFYWEGKTIELTKEKAGEIKDKFKNLFKQTDDLIATSDVDLKDGQKLHIMNLLEHKGVLESFQGAKNPKVQKQVKDEIDKINSKLERLLNGESVTEVMKEPDESEGLGVNVKNMSEASKNVIRHRKSGKEWGTEEHKNTVRGLKLEIDRLEKIENRTKEQNRLLSLHQELLKDVEQIKPTINEETDPIVEEQIKETIRDESGKSAPGIEGETKRAPKDSEVKSVREADGTTSRQVTPINDRSRIKDVLGKNVTYKGKKGILQRDSDGDIIIRTPEGSFVIRNKKGPATQNQILKTHGIKATGSSFTINPEGKISVNNNPKQDIVGMIKNEDGDLESMVVTDPGLTDRQSKIAKNKFKRLKKRLDNGEITQSEFNTEVSNIKGVNLLTDPDILTDVATENLINEMLSKKDTSVIDMAEVDAIIEEEKQIEAEKEARENYRKESEKRGKEIEKNQTNKKGTRYKNTKESRNDLRNRAAVHRAAGGPSNKRKATVLKMIDKILAPLGLDVIVHNDSDSMYNDLRKSGMTRQEAYAKMNSKGFILMGNGEIHINLDRASGNTVFHEAAHPFVQIIKKAKQAEKGKGPVTKLWNDITKNLETQKRPNRDTTYMDFGIMSVRNEDGSYNTDDAVEEALAEYLGDAGLDQFKNDQTALNKAKEFARKILEFFGVNVNKNPLKVSIEDMSNIEDVKNRFQSTIPKGKEINIDEEYRGETEVEPEVKPEPKKATQKQRVETVLKDEGEMSIQEISKKTKILEPNVRRILGVGAKDGTFERVDKGVYVLKHKGKEHAYIQQGNALDVLEKLAKKGKKFDMIFLDPPYSEGGQKGGNRDLAAFETMNSKNFGKLMSSVTKLLKSDDSHVYFMFTSGKSSKKGYDAFVNGILKSGLKPVGKAGWKKVTKTRKKLEDDLMNNKITQDQFNEKVSKLKAEGFAGFPYPTGYGALPTEDIIVFSKSGKKRAGEIELNDYFVEDGDTRIGRTFNFMRPKYDYTKTEKPKELLEALIKGSTFKGESVLDPFGGSGTTLEQAIKTGRKVTTIEIDPVAVEKIKERGEKAYKDSPKFQIDETNHSTTLDAIKHSTIGRGTPTQWMNNLKMVGDENIVEDLKFLGMSNFLESAERLYADDLIPKQALEDYVTLNKTKVEEISNSEIKISNPLYDLGNIRYTKKIDEDGNNIMLIEDVIAPDNEMSSNIEPIVRRLVRYSSDLGFDGLAFKPGQNFDGPKQVFFNETIPDVIRDVASNIDKSAGPTVTNIDGEAHNSIDITNKVKTASTRINLPSFQVDEGIDPDMEYVHQMYNGKLSFATDFIRKWLTPSGPGGFDAYNRQREMLGRKKAKLEAVKAAQERLQKAIDNNNTFTLEQVNDALTDPSTLIRSLEGEITAIQMQIDNLSKGMTSEQMESNYTLRTKRGKIREIESRIKELKDNHRGKTKLKDLESDPELKDAVRNAREMIDNLSQSLINQGVVQGELKGTVLANKSIYLMKQYRAHHDMDYIKKQMNAIEMAKKAGEGEFYNSATTIGRVTTFVRNQLQEKYERELEQYNNGQIDTRPKKVTMNMVQQEVVKVFKSKNNNTVYNRAVHISKPSNAIFKKRKDMPEEIVDFLGEIENPSWNFAHTAEQMINSLELTTYRSDIVKTLMAAGNGKFIIEGIPTTGDLQKKLTETIEVDGKTYSVTKDIYKQVEGIRNKPWKGFQYYMKFLGYTKLGLTVYNPITHVRNFTANVGFAVMNGHINFSTLKNTTTAWGIATNIFRSSSNAKRSELWESMIEEGIIDETVGLEEINDLLRSDGSERSFFESLDKSARRGPLGKVQRAVENTYRFEDVVWKVTGFLQEMQTAEKAGMSRQDAIKRAGYVIRNTYPNYSAVPLIAKKLRVNPLVGSFVSFPAEVIRTSLMTIKIAKDELASGNPVLVKRGAARMTGTIINLVAMPTLTKLGVYGMMALMGFDDEENYSLDKKIAESLKFIGAPWNEFGTLIPISNPKGGEWYSWNIHDNLSHGYLYDIANSLFNTPADDPTKDRGFLMSLFGDNPALTALLDPFIGTDVLFKAVDEAYKNKDSNGKPIHPDNIVGDLAGARKFIAKLGHILYEVRPGIYKTVERFMDPKADKQREILGNFLGIRFGKTNVAQAVYYRSRDVMSNITGLDPKFQGSAEQIMNEVIRNLEYLEKLYYHAKVLGLEEQFIEDIETGIKTTPVEDDPTTEIDETMLATEGARTVMDNAKFSKAIIQILLRRDPSVPIRNLGEIYFDGILSERQQEEYNKLLEQ